MKTLKPTAKKVIQFLSIIFGLDPDKVIKELENNEDYSIDTRAVWIISGNLIDEAPKLVVEIINIDLEKMKEIINELDESIKDKLKKEFEYIKNKLKDKEENKEDDIDVIQKAVKVDESEVDKTKCEAIVRAIESLVNDSERWYIAYILVGGEE